MEFWRMLGMALLFLLSTCDIVYAQNLPNQLKVPSFQGTHSKTNQTQKSSQKRPNRCAEEKSGQRIPKPERNRLDEGKAKKVTVSRKRKKSQKTTTIKKRRRKTNSEISDDEKPKSTKQKGGKKELEVKTERIDGKEKKWTERVLIVNSPAYAKQKEKGLEKRLQNAEKKIHALNCKLIF